jgi:hypothetical protein
MAVDSTARTLDIIRSNSKTITSLLRDLRGHRLPGRAR